jgi:hypothetical protein
MTFRRIAGIGFVFFGIANLIDLPIPTVGLSAFIVGGLFITAGAILAIPQGFLAERLKRLAISATRSTQAPRPSLDPILPVRVLKLAEKRAGLLSVSAVAMSLDIGLDEAQASLDDLVRKGAAQSEIDMSTGIATYRFPEFLPREQK